MTTRSDEGPEFAPDDPLAVVLRPPSGYLGPPAGRFETIRRRAARRRRSRAVAGLGLVCAAAALVVWPLKNAVDADRPASPTVPLAPPPVSDSSSPATLPSVSPEPAEPPPGRPAATDGPAVPPGSRVVPTPAPPVTDGP
ncbi:hypothetical protein ACF052_07255 [Streptomyces pilosus]|uniref:hypothetical protein n=1 Tax=Streptomyces pilosus TaxID=28893 RepID=UPI0036F77BE1